MKAIVQQRLADSMALNLPTLVEREARLPRIPDKAFAVIGMRRAGKTYFLFQQMGRLLIQGVDRSRLVYFNFEDERLAGMTSADLHWIPDEYYVMSPQNRSHKVHFFSTKSSWSTDGKGSSGGSWIRKTLAYMFPDRRPNCSAAKSRRRCAVAPWRRSFTGDELVL